jgi:hypothetical protein
MQITAWRRTLRLLTGSSRGVIMTQACSEILITPGERLRSFTLRRVMHMYSISVDYRRPCLADRRPWTRSNRPSFYPDRPTLTRTVRLSMPDVRGRTRTAAWHPNNGEHDRPVRMYRCTNRIHIYRTCCCTPCAKLLHTTAAVCFALYIFKL